LIQALPVRTLSGLLEWATGVEIQSRSPAQSDLGIRGAGFEQVVVLVNGVRMSDPQTGHFDLDLAVPLDGVERVEILRGPASALYGADAMGGVVNIVTRRGGEVRKGRLEGGSWGGLRIATDLGVEREGGGDFQLSGEYGRSDGHRPGTDFETILLHLGLNQPAGSGAVSFDLGLSRRDFGAQDFYAPYPSFEKTRSYTSGLRWASTGSGGLRFEAGLSGRVHQDEFTLIRSDPGVYQNRHTSSQLGTDVLIKRGLGDSAEGAVGGELFGDLLRSGSLGDRGEARGAVFTELVLGGRGPGVVNVGLRQDWHEGFGSFFSPSVSSSLRLGSAVRARAAAGRSFRAPTWTERYYQDPVNVGRADLDPERAWSGELGLDLVMGSSARLSVTGFLRKAENLIDWARPVSDDPGLGDPPPWETRNVEDATFQGVEADLSYETPFGAVLTLGAMALSVESSESAGYLSKYAFRPLTEQLNLGFRKTLGGRVILGLNMQRARRKGEDHYLRFALRNSVRLGRVVLYLDAQNLFDSEYPDVTGASAPGRSIFLGMEVGG